MSAEGISDELVEQVGKDLRERYGLDDEDVRLLAARLADDPGSYDEPRTSRSPSASQASIARRSSASRSSRR